MSNTISWTCKGPPTRRKFHEIIDTSVPAILKECQNLFCSEPVFLLLSNITGLKLHPLSEDVDGDDEGSGSHHRDGMGKVSSSIRKWSHGSYTLLHDQSFTQSSFLNAQLYFNCSEWDPEFGGYTSYVAEYENEELLQTDPKPNSLALVYITEGTSHFTKYINHRAAKQPFLQKWHLFRLGLSNLRLAGCLWPEENINVGQEGNVKHKRNMMK
ncbi:2-oxoglutarate and iron-dependent oxygenase domain-containing protein 1, partial [Stegodyphus mimosarum]